MPKSTKKPAVKAVKKAAPKSKPTAKKPAAPRPKAPARAPVRRTTAAPKAAPKTAAGKVVTSEAIALKAYYLGERRRHLGMPGDPQSDWLEAERLLRGS
jgi:hypothetical protein